VRNDHSVIFSNIEIDDNPKLSVLVWFSAEKFEKRKIFACSNGEDHTRIKSFVNTLLAPGFQSLKKQYFKQQHRKRRVKSLAMKLTNKLVSYHYLSILFILLNVCYSSIASAQGTLYRFDTRSPETIFKEGFSSKGDLFSIKTHVSEAITDNSAFISSTDDYSFTLKLLIGYRVSGNEGYIYRFKVPPNSFDALPTLRANEPADQVSDLSEFFENGGTEVLTAKKIPNNYIIDAVSLDGSALKTQDNPGYTSPKASSISKEELPYAESDPESFLAKLKPTNRSPNCTIL